MPEEVTPYTPTTEQVKERYLSAVIDQGYGSEEFDRWLASVKAQAITDVADQMRDRFTAAWLRGKAREYTHGPRKIVGAFATPESNQEVDCGDQDV